jgi:hypothetical protein
VKTAFLYIETHLQWPGLVRIGVVDSVPPTGLRGQRRTHYVARFTDAEAALMHTHELLKRRLLDPDERLYRVSPVRAIAAAMSLGLRHTDVYLDDDLGEAERAQIDVLVDRFRARRRHVDRIFAWLGYGAIGLLLFNLFFLSLP